MQFFAVSKTTRNLSWEATAVFVRQLKTGGERDRIICDLSDLVQDYFDAFGLTLAVEIYHETTKLARKKFHLVDGNPGLSEVLLVLRTYLHCEWTGVRVRPTSLG